MTVLTRNSPTKLRPPKQSRQPQCSGVNLSSWQGDAELFQALFEIRGASVAVLIAEGVKSGGVVHLGKVGEFVTDYVVTEF